MLCLDILRRPYFHCHMTFILLDLWFRKYSCKNNVLCVVKQAQLNHEKYTSWYLYPHICLTDFGNLIFFTLLKLPSPQFARHHWIELCPSNEYSRIIAKQGHSVNSAFLFCLLYCIELGDFGYSFRLASVMSVFVFKKSYKMWGVSSSSLSFKETCTETYQCDHEQSCLAWPLKTF